MRPLEMEVSDPPRRCARTCRLPRTRRAGREGEDELRAPRACAGQCALYVRRTWARRPRAPSFGTGFGPAPSGSLGGAFPGRARRLLEAGGGAGGPGVARSGVLRGQPAAGPCLLARGPRRPGWLVPQLLS